MITDHAIEVQRCAGDITLVFKNGTEEQKASLLRAIEQVSGTGERERIEAWIAEGMPGS